MDIFHIIGDFFLSAWLWQNTFDLFYPVVAGVIMFFMLRIVLRRRRVRSLLITAAAQLFAFVTLELLVQMILIEMFNWTFEPLDDARYALTMMHELYASLCLGLIYAVFQTIYFFLGRIFFRYNALAFCMVAWISNGIGMLLSYLFIRMFILWRCTN